MIDRIELRNIQSHKDSELVFSKGVNAIVGSSNSGKTAILRALYWVRYNRPLGIDNLASHWIFNGENLAGEISVKVTQNNREIERKRTKTVNQYIVDGEVLNVVKTDVPAVVESAMNLTETNIQKQQDAPFLLSQSSSQVAQYFNRVVKLDVIDRVLTKAEIERRRINSEINATNSRITELEHRFDEFSFVDSAKIIISRFDVVDCEKNKLISELEKLEKDFEKYEKAKSKIIDLETQKDLVTCLESNSEKVSTKKTELVNVEKNVENYESKKIYKDFAAEKQLETLLQSTLDALSEKRKILSKIESEIKLFNNFLTKTFDLENPKNILETLSKSKESVSERKKELEGVTNGFDRFIEIVKIYSEALNRIDELKAELPDICPLCGGVLK